MTFTTVNFFNESDHELNYHASFADHEPGLWRAVITQALMDAASQSRKTEAQRSREEALKWLTSDQSDFPNVCDNAGLNPDYVRTRALRALQRGCEWRLPSGQGWRTQARLRTQSTPFPLNQ